MKIGIEVQRLFRKKRFGIEIAAVELLHELHKIKTNHQFIILAAQNNHENKLYDCKNFTIRTVRGKLFFDFEQFFLPVAAKHEQLNILHCTGNTTPLYCSKPIVQTLHDIIFLDPIPKSDSYYQRYGNLYRRIIVPQACKKSEAIITVSNYEKKRMVERLKIEEEKVHVIHNGVSSIFKKTVDAEKLKETRIKYCLPDNFILFLGNTSARKNPERVLAAYLGYAKKSTAPLPLVTPGLPRDFILDNLKKSGELNLINKIYAPGYIDQDDLVHLYSLSKLFLFPSLSEGFGMPLLEAMACGVPVITSNTSALPEIAGDAAKLIDPNSVENIRDAIHELLEHPALLEDYCHRGLKQVQNFQWKHAAEKTLDIYERVYHKSINR
ncbi:MAG: glycosyltransferase family 4 protein [Cyclobacteriaceae bacterium]|nr:glycosyltransferase family 4 protein [Cyclobacteriaceae bacterium]UYN85809.1 MAG: glycosyltransferase family 4 protein [Cyclobacteriaceae bacterium]